MNEILSAISSADIAVLDYIQARLKTPFLDAIMPFITHLASAGFIWIVITVILLCIKKFRREGIVMAISLLLCFILCNVLLKNIVARVRPFDINTSVMMIIKKPSDFSFPSGHTTASFAAAISLLLCKNKTLGIPALIAALAIAFSRLYLYVHFPTDVIAGIFLGAISAFTAYIIYSKTHIFN